MKLATSTNIMDADCNRPYQIPVDVSARACAHAAINMSMPACAAIAERDSRCGANTGKSGSLPQWH